MPLEVNLTVTDDQRTRVSRLLPPQKPVIGRPMLDHHQIVADMLWVARTGASGLEMPADYGPWQTIDSRYRRWRSDGTWQRIIDTFPYL